MVVDWGRWRWYRTGGGGDGRGLGEVEMVEDWGRWRW